MSAPICAWCVAPDPAQAGQSHGICDRCMELMLAQADAKAAVKA